MFVLRIQTAGNEVRAMNMNETYIHQTEDLLGPEVQLTMPCLDNRGI